jgi:hypothetical protein
LRGEVVEHVSFQGSPEELFKGQVEEDSSTEFAWAL